MVLYTGPQYGFQGLLRIPRPFGTVNRPNEVVPLRAPSIPFGWRPSSIPPEPFDAVVPFGFDFGRPRVGTKKQSDLRIAEDTAYDNYYHNYFGGPRRGAGPVAIKKKMPLRFLGRRDLLRGRPGMISMNMKRRRYPGRRTGFRRGVMRTNGFYGKFNRPGGVELKFLDTALSGLVDNTAEIPATGGQLCIIPQGNTQSTRIGRKVMIRSIHIKGMVRQEVTTYKALTDAAVETAHIYVILDTQCNGAAATIGDSNSGVFTTSNLNTGFRTLSNSGRFKILKHFVFNMQPVAGVSGALFAGVKHFDWYHKCHIPIEYDASGTDGAITTIRSNNIFVAIGGSGVNDDAFTVNAATRIRFSDL